MNAKDEILRLAKDIGNIEAIRMINKNTQETKLFLQDQIKDALKIIDYEFDDGLGIEEGPVLVVWTIDSIIFKHEYDGAENFVAIPRHPTAEFIPETITMK